MTPAGKSLTLGTIVVVVFALVLWVVIPMGVWIPARVPIAANSPDFWPRVIAIGMLVLGVLELGHGVLAMRSGNTSTAEAPDDTDSASYPPITAALRVAVAMLLMLGYYYAVQWLGMLVASAVAILIFAGLYGERRPWLLLAVAVILPVVLYGFFVGIAHTPLPQGVFG